MKSRAGINKNLTDYYFVVTKPRANKSHGSMILARKATTKIKVETEKSDKNERRKIFEIIKASFEVAVLSHLWVIVPYNSQGLDLNLTENFEFEMKNVFFAEISTLHIKN